MKFKKLLIPVVLAACAALGYTLYKVIPNLVSSSPKGSVYRLWKEYYSNQCDDAVEAIKKEFGISDARWQQVITKIDGLKRHDPVFTHRGNVSTSNSVDQHPLVAKTRSLLQHHGLNANAVEILCTEEGQSPAAAIQEYHESPEHVKTYIKLHIPKLEQRSPDIQEAIIRHEIIHLVNYDSIEEGYLLSLLSDMGYSEAQWNIAPSMIHYRHLKEFRADQLAAAHGGIKVAQAFQSDFCGVAFHNATSSHPASRTRAAQINVVIDHLNNQNQSIRMA